MEPEVLAVQRVFEALKPLDGEGQQRVLSAALSLLGLSFNLPHASNEPSHASLGSVTASSSSSGARPKGLTEFVSEKKPGTSAQRILLFAYYRDKYEGINKFAPGDIRPYFAKARLTPPGNFDRDFASAVEKGWIHQDGENSYMTQTGASLVDSDFSGARTYAAVRTQLPQAHPKKKTKKK